MPTVLCPSLSLTTLTRTPPGLRMRSGGKDGLYTQLPTGAEGRTLRNVLDLAGGDVVNICRALQNVNTGALASDALKPLLRLLGLRETSSLTLMSGWWTEGNMASEERR